MDRRTLILGAAGIMLAPGRVFADTAPIHGKVRLDLGLSRATLSRSDPGVDVETRLIALQPISVLTTGDFVDDGFHVQVISPNGATSPISALLRRGGELTARDFRVRRLNPGQSHVQRYRLDSRLAFPVAGAYTVQGSYGPPDPTRPQLRRQGQRALALADQQRVARLMSQAGVRLLRPEDGDILSSGASLILA